MNTTTFLRAAALVSACCAAPIASAQTVVTTFADASNTDPKVWFAADVRTGATASIEDLAGLGGTLENNQLLPTGAALLTTDLTNEAKAEVGVLDDYGAPNEMFPNLALSYAYFKADDGSVNAAAAPALKLTFVNEACPSGGDCFGQLIYEPYWNQANPPSAVNPPIGQWMQVNIDQNSGYFWSSGMFGESNSAGGPPLRTLAEWLATMNADFGTARLIQVSIGMGTYNPGQIGYFDNVQIVHAGFNESYDFDVQAPATVARVRVTKQFTDGRTDPVDVTLSCNSGNPLQQSFTITGGDPAGVTFVVDGPVDGTLCEVTESGGPAGYTPVMNGGQGCSFTVSAGDDRLCEIVNEPGPATYTVANDWSVPSAGAEEPNYDVDVTISCDRDILALDGTPLAQPAAQVLVTLGDGESAVATVDTAAGAATCSAMAAAAQSGAETEASAACGGATLAAGGSAECRFTHTVFFEGIPTLSAYGKAMLLLTLLGVGFVALRRMG